MRGREGSAEPDILALNSAVATSELVTLGESLPLPVPGSASVK